jgi:hypothetical protein
MQDEFAALMEPALEGLRGGGRTPSFREEVGGAATRAQGLTRRVGGGEPFGPPSASQRLGSCGSSMNLIRNQLFLIRTGSEQNC